MNEENPKENPINPAALESVSKGLESLKAARASNAHEAHAPPAGAARAAVDFLSALAVCSLIGYGLDYWQDTSPWGLLVGLLAGAGIGARLMLLELNQGNR